MRMYGNDRVTLSQLAVKKFKASGGPPDGFREALSLMQRITVLAYKDFQSLGFWLVYFNLYPKDLQQLLAGLYTSLYL